MLKAKYQDVLDLGEELNFQDGYVEETQSKLKIGGTAEYQYDCDRIWDKIKEHDGWQDELEVDMNVAKKDIYGVYTVKSGDTLSKISKALLGDAMRYMDIFNINKDILDNPDLITIGQKLKLPNRS